MKQMSLLLLMMLVGCATPYESKPDSIWRSGGYSETQLSANTFDVYFEGRAKEDERIRDFVLLRAAELCISHQYSFFSILEQGATLPVSNSTNSVIAVSSGGRSVTPVVAYGNGSDGRLNIRNRVQCFGDENEQSAAVYNADFVQDTVRLKYAIY